MKYVNILLASLFFANIVLAQSSNEIKRYLEMVEKGQADSVRPYLPELIAKYQQDAGVLYLQARVTTSGIEAVKLYQSIVTNFPNSEWADDALYRIYQYYYALGLYKTAEQTLHQLKKDYPNSTYLTGTADIKHPETDESKPIFAEELSDTVATAPSQDVKVTSNSSEDEKTTSGGGIAVKPSQGKYTLQIGAFSTSANAEKQKSLLASYNQPIEIKSSVRNGRKLYLVLVGSFQTQEEAKNVGRDLKVKYNLQSIVVEK